ncbi:MAG: hypothetical protein GX416_02230 [Bacteroidales bacterium]|nr:hypothetical protein [Bacteroidales bacterium]
MKIYKLILCSFIVLLLCACSNEDELTPSNVKENYYAADSSATDPVSILRQDFYKKNNCYLLFNDTLRHELLSKDRDGNNGYFTETVDIGYMMTSATMPEKYTYKYIESFDDKKAAVTFLESNILPHLSAKLRPFSWLLIKNISEYKTVDEGVTYTYKGDDSYAVGDRCTAIAMSGLSNLDDKELHDFAQSLLSGILMNKINKQSSSLLESFTKYGNSLYEKYSGITPINGDANMILLEQSGFIVPYYFANVFIVYGCFPSKSDDINSYVKLVVTKTDDEVNALYGNYPVVMNKYQIMKTILLNLGYVF